MNARMVSVKPAQESGKKDLVRRQKRTTESRSQMKSVDIWMKETVGLEETALSHQGGRKTYKEEWKVRKIA